MHFERQDEIGLTIDRAKLESGASSDRLLIEALSETFTNPELVTSSNPKNSPIVILKGKWEALGGSYQIIKAKENTITVILRRTSKNDVQGQESEPGFYSPSDWGYA